MLLMGMAPGFVIGLVFLRCFVAAINFDIRDAFVSYLPMFGLLVLALTSVLREWPWPLRLALHLGWLLALAIPTVLWNM